MKSTVRVLQISALILAISIAAVLIAADSHPAGNSGLTVHEWGTFTSVAGEDGSAIDWDTLGGKDDLPRFVNNTGYRCTKRTVTGTVRMETPVVYFYSPRELDAQVKVAFPQGIITEWYPQAGHKILQKNRFDGSVRALDASLNGIDPSMSTLTGTIEWKNIKIQPDSALPLPLESGPSHYYAARGTDSAPITVGNQHEKFLFYRGVGRFPVPLSARVSSDGKIAVENRGSDAVPFVILFENRGGRLGYRNAGAVQDAITIDSPSLDSSFPVLRHDLETALVAQGLFPKEAHAMVETWRDSWFEEGTRLIYIVPSRALDAILPLEINPTPSRTARVFVGRIELVTPETMRTVEAAIAKNDSSVIERYRRFLDPVLKRISSEAPLKTAQLERFRQNLRISLTRRGAGSQSSAQARAFNVCRDRPRRDCQIALTCLC